MTPPYLGTRIDIGPRGLTAKQLTGVACTGLEVNLVGKFDVEDFDQNERGSCYVLVRAGGDMGEDSDVFTVDPDALVRVVDGVAWARQIVEEALLERGQELDEEISQLSRGGFDRPASSAQLRAEAREAEVAGLAKKLLGRLV